MSPAESVAAPDGLPADMGEVVPLGEVESALDRLMRAAQGHGQEPVMHACMSNLVVYCGRPELAHAVMATLADVVTLHPARVFLLLAEPEARTAELTARINVRAHEAEAHRVYSEQVTLHATGSTVQRLPYVVRGLVIGDLPINLWWAEPLAPPLGGVLFHDLAEGVEQVLYDSIGWPRPARGVVAVAGWLEKLERAPRPGHWRVASDLNWRRLKTWRRLLAQALDPALAPGVLEGITEVALEHGPHGVVQAWELASWLAARLDWRLHEGRVQPGVEIHWQLDSRHGRVRLRLRRLEQGPPAILKLRIAFAVAGKEGALCFTSQEEGRRLAVLPEGGNATPRTVAVTQQPVPELVARQLSDRERDPVFRQSMAVARALAESVVQAV
jgi:glucose-6-phosphate dehydrogenase assembly protein OpcA